MNYPKSHGKKKLKCVTTTLRERLSHNDIEHHHHDEANGKTYGAII